MPLSPAGRKYLKSVYQRLDERPLPPGDPMYQPLYGGDSDPVALMANHIEFTDVESMQTFSGFQGSGKTTELPRLKKRLEDAGGYVVLYSNAMEYLNPAEPVDIAELLPVVAGAFSDALIEHGPDIVSESYWTRLKNYLSKTDVELTEAADKMIAVCGGHFRDLLLLVRETVLRTQTLPVTEETVDAAIAQVRGNFLPISVEDARWLDEIGRLRQSVLQTSSPAEVNRLTRFLDTHFVLYLKNGDEWYDIRPLIRDEVSRIVERARAIEGR